MQNTKWYAIGDLNAFFALFLDNVINLVILAGILMSFGFPRDIILTKMIPGTALGVMIGDLIYSWIAIKLQKKEGRPITAMPLGLDTPSTIGVALVVLGPAFLFFQNSLKLDSNQAALYTWFLGSAILIWMGIVKLVVSFFGDFIQKVVPVAGLLGSLAGIGMVWLSANALVSTFHHPFVGIISLGLIFFTLVAQLKMPYNLPGAAFAVLFSTLLYYGLHFTGYHLIPSDALPATKDFGFFIPLVNIHAFEFFFRKETLAYLPIAIPFGILTIVGGINICVAARMAGDNFKTRQILLTEAFATLAAGIFGGVSQSTPYIGQGAYRQMGARSAYTLATGIIIGIGGSLGLISFIVNLIPESAVAPILVFIGFEITAAAYQATEKRYMVATTFAILPSILNFGYIKVKSILAEIQNLIQKSVEAGAEKINLFDSAVLGGLLNHTFNYLEALAQGFIITAMVWGAVVTFLIDRKLKNAAITLFAATVLCLFGLIHSATGTGELYIPWSYFQGTFFHSIPFQFSLSYFLLGCACLIVHFYYNRKGLKFPEFEDHQSEEFATN